MPGNFKVKINDQCNKAKVIVFRPCPLKRPDGQIILFCQPQEHLVFKLKMFFLMLLFDEIILKLTLCMFNTDYVCIKEKINQM